MKKFISAALIFLLCALLVCAVGEDDPVAVRVGDKTYPASLLQFTLTTAIDINETGNQGLTDDDKQLLTEQALMKYVDIGIIEMKLEEAGLNDFTEQEMEDIRYTAESEFETVWQGLYEQLRAENDEVTEKEVTDWLISRGYTVENFQQDAMATIRVEKALMLFCPDVTLTPAEILEYYQTNFVEPDRAAYENDVPRYEEEILLRNNEAFFVPEGYYYVKHILLDFPDEVKEAMAKAGEESGAAEEARKAAYDELAEAAAGDGDIGPLREAYHQKVTEKEEKDAAFYAEMEKAVPALKEKTDAIYARLANGERFEDLMAEYSIDELHQKTTDKGYLFHPQSEQWAKNFSEAAAKLQKEGDLSEPVLTDAGVHIIRYMAPMAGGIHKLTAEEQAVLEETALRAARTEVLNEMLAEWRNEVTWEIHPELLDPEL